MVSERTQRQIDRLLDEAEEAMRQIAWETVRARIQAVLSLDPENIDAHNYLAAADREVSAAGTGWASEAGYAAPGVLRHRLVPGQAPPGEGGKKRVCLALDSRRDRDVAFSLIKTEGLDDEGRERIEREPQRWAS